VEIPPTRPGTGRLGPDGAPRKPATAKLPRSDQFEVTGQLGRGGMGVVYKARERASGRDVALKVVLDSMSPTRLERFRREGEICARLSHPGIVKVHSTGELEGKPYLACELVEGAKTLGDVFHQVDLRRRVELLRDAARALGHAHAQGIAHRDVKPDNILVDSRGQVKVADFGLAAAEDFEALTRTGVLLGTPTHMPPEQFKPSKDGQGPPGDVWSLGVVLYQALAGKLPFPGASIPELSAKICHLDPDPPARANAAVPPELEAICLQCLRRDPTRRYADGELLAQDLDAWLAGKPVSARPPSLLGRVARGRLWLAAPALLIVVLIVLAVTYRPRRAPPSPPPPAGR
jgi:serine/threonine protein kinase